MNTAVIISELFKGDSEMKCYLIKETLCPCSIDDFPGSDCQYAAVLTWKEWEENRDRFDMGIDMDMERGIPKETKAVVNIDSLTGSLSRPALAFCKSQEEGFTFALDEKGIVLVDDTGYVNGLIVKIQLTKKWRLPSMERFLYDLLECSISRDLAMLDEMEQSLNKMEERIAEEQSELFPPEMNQIRGDLLDLRIHYEQLIDLSQELEENENNFFREERLRYFHMFTERTIRLQLLVSGMREYVMQLKDLIQTSIDVRQNRIMTVLTVITSIFLPLTLIAGWYGMNFKYMPELEWEFGYPMVIIISIVIVVVSLIFFRKKKWL